MKYDQKAGLGILIGLFVLGLSLRADKVVTPRGSFALPLVWLAGMGLFMWGCANYAMGKGYSKWLGLLGMIGCIGLLVLMVLPDRRKEFDDHTS